MSTNFFCCRIRTKDLTNVDPLQGSFSSGIMYVEVLYNDSDVSSNEQVHNLCNTLLDTLVEYPWCCLISKTRCDETKSTDMTSSQQLSDSFGWLWQIV